MKFRINILPTEVNKQSSQLDDVNEFVSRNNENSNYIKRKGVMFKKAPFYLYLYRVFNIAYHELTKCTAYKDNEEINFFKALGWHDVTECTICGHKALENTQFCSVCGQMLNGMIEGDRQVSLFNKEYEKYMIKYRERKLIEESKFLTNNGWTTLKNGNPYIVSTSQAGLLTLNDLGYASDTAYVHSRNDLRFDVNIDVIKRNIKYIYGEIKESNVDKDLLEKLLTDAIYAKPNIRFV